MGERISTGKGGKKDLREEKGEDLRGEKGGNGGKDLNRERGGKILGRKREKISGGKGLRGERGKGSQQRKGGKDLRGEGDNSKGTQIRKQACNVGGLSRRR